jgi:small multidrug resistance pump
MRGWIFLALAIACEISGTTCMKLSHSFTRLVPSVLLFIFYGATLVNMTIAMKYLEIGLVYAVWSGVGTAVVAVIGIAVFHESLSVAKVACIAMIIGGVVGLNLASKPPAPSTETPIEEEHL